ncbi:MAG: insulinase family protein [Abitibacteriaceae bacterium]|nr:insulinase family protein [Abditibacteriaceae bacterium]
MTSFKLDNGLQVILHEDHSTPIVAVNVWYHVGSKNEVPGHTGFAHLFEHLMFQGSKHYDEDYFKPLQEVGGTLNGTTSSDRTNFWEVVPSNFLGLALSMEADRMGYLLDTLTQEKLNTQREVVKNEKRQNYDNRPYGLAHTKLAEALFPSDHPYHWITIGSLDDIDKASLEDVKEFFRLYYVPSNASLVIAGDFDPAQARHFVEKYFGPLPTGLDLQPVTAPQPKLAHEVRVTMEDRVAVPRLYLSWPTVPQWSPDAAALDVLANGLADSKLARLYKALVYDRQIAQDVSVYHDDREIAGQFIIAATARPGKSLTELKTAIDDELARLKAAPPTVGEVDRIYNALEAAFVYDLQTVEVKADQLNRYGTFLKRPNYFPEDLARYRRVTPADVQRVANKYLTDKRVVLSVVPTGGDRNNQPKAQIAQQDSLPASSSAATSPTTIPPAKAEIPAATAGQEAGSPNSTHNAANATSNDTTNISASPEASAAHSSSPTPAGNNTVAAAPTTDSYERPTPQPDPVFSLPHLQRRRLSNGLPVLIVEQHELPIVSFNLVVKAGAAADPPERAGLAALTSDLLDEGTGTRSALTISSELAGVGARLSTWSGWDVSNVNLLTLTRHLDQTLPIYASVIADPAFPVKELERMRTLRLAALQQKNNNPDDIAAVVYASLLYGRNHPYGHLPGGVTDSISTIQQDDVRHFYDTYYRPNNAALIVVGDVKPDALMIKLERAFFGWKKGRPKPVNITTPPPRDRSEIYLVDKPGAPQSVIAMGQVGVSRSTPDYFPLLVLNDILGGQFTSRLNMNLRQTKGYTYGARTYFSYRRSPGPFTATAGVQTAVTKDAISEFLKELSGVRGSAPITAAEVEYAKESIIRGFPRTFETPEQIADHLTDIVLYDLPDDYFDHYLEGVRSVTLEDVQRAANHYIDPAHMAVLVVGDRKSIEPSLRSLDQIGSTLKLLDPQGRPVTQ